MTPTPIVNYTIEDTGTATLTRAVPKVDANIEGTNQWVVDLVAGVDEAGADHVAPALPQVGTYLARARDGEGSAQITIKPTSRDLRITLQRSDGTVVVEGVAAEIRHIRMHLTEKAQNYVVRLCLHGVSPEGGAALVAALTKPLEITASPTQQAFGFDGAELGSIVSADCNGTAVFGVLRKRTSKGLVVEDFGAIFTVDKVKSAIVLADGWEDNAEEYRRGATGWDTQPPSWRWLLTAMSCVGDGTNLTPDVVSAAVAEHIPQEAGASA